MADGNAAAMKEKEQGNAAYKSKNFTKVNSGVVAERLLCILG